MVHGPEIALKLPCNGLEYGLSLWNCKKVLSEILLGHFNLERLAHYRLRSISCPSFFLSKTVNPEPSLKMHPCWPSSHHDIVLRWF